MKLFANHKRSRALYWDSNYFFISWSDWSVNTDCPMSTPSRFTYTTTTKPDWTRPVTLAGCFQRFVKMFYTKYHITLSNQENDDHESDATWYHMSIQRHYKVEVNRHSYSITFIISESKHHIYGQSKSSYFLLSLDDVPTYPTKLLHEVCEACQLISIVERQSSSLDANIN